MDKLAKAMDIIKRILCTQQVRPALPRKKAVETIRGGSCCPIAYDTTVVHCKWCRGQVRIYISAIRHKTASWDTGHLFSKSDYHEECWNEAIEVCI
ncbi:hypothetical protein LCGC14_0664350 [marine sediment metagenome]|uniref:Uncharacterized protein n=1 Tax=marine sediment metagenome TaxID=412755 RepID=A0A0F9QXW8_9ZZZZ